MPKGRHSCQTHDGYSLLRQVAVGSRSQGQISSENEHSHN